MLSTITEIDTPKNRSKDERPNLSDDDEKSAELTLEQQQRLASRLADIFQTSKDSTKNFPEFANFSTYLKALEQNGGFGDVFDSLKIPDGSMDHSESSVNIVSELNKRNIYLSSSTSSESKMEAKAGPDNEDETGDSSNDECSNRGESADKQGDRKFNLKDFLAKELEKRIATSPVSIDSVSSSIINSLFGSLNDKPKTSTPNFDSSSIDKTITDMFSISPLSQNSK